MSHCSGECLFCQNPIRFDIPGEHAGVIPITGSLHPGCGHLMGFDGEREFLQIFREHPAHVIRTFAERDMGDTPEANTDKTGSGKEQSTMGKRYRHRYSEDVKTVSLVAAKLAGDIDASVDDAVRLIQTAERKCAEVKAARIAGDEPDEYPQAYRTPWLRRMARDYMSSPGFDRREAGHGPFGELLAHANNKNDPARQLEALEILLLVSGLLNPKAEGKEDVK